MFAGIKPSLSVLLFCSCRVAQQFWDFNTKPNNCKLKYPIAHLGCLGKNLLSSLTSKQLAPKLPSNLQLKTCMFQSQLSLSPSRAFGRFQELQERIQVVCLFSTRRLDLLVQNPRRIHFKSRGFQLLVRELKEIPCQIPHLFVDHSANRSMRVLRTTIPAKCLCQN